MENPEEESGGAAGDSPEGEDGEEEEEEEEEESKSNEPASDDEVSVWVLPQNIIFEFFCVDVMHPIAPSSLWFNITFLPLMLFFPDEGC